MAARVFNTEQNENKDDCCTREPQPSTFCSATNAKFCSGETRIPFPENRTRVRSFQMNQRARWQPMATSGRAHCSSDGFDLAYAMVAPVRHQHVPAAVHRHILPSPPSRQLPNPRPPLPHDLREPSRPCRRGEETAADRKHHGFAEESQKWRERTRT
eukprot:3549151-Rhodomonas_salina.1